jgi:hypothetical protein
MSAPKHPPGSLEAIAQGCTCSPVVNHEGQGSPGPRGRYYECDWKCPLHGLDVAKKVIAANDARIISPPLKNDEPTQH